jgi:hypothetical protein
MSRVLDVLKEYYSVTGGNISVSGSEVRIVSNDGSYVIINFTRPISDIMKGVPSSGSVRIGR